MILILHWRQLLDVARGLTYLHQCDLVHGNLTGVSPNFSCHRPDPGGTDSVIAKHSGRGGWDRLHLGVRP